MDWITDPQAWIALGTLTALEIVLGIDNLIFIVILVGRLPEKVRAKARFVGIALAMISRILLLLSLSWMLGLTKSVFTLLGQGISGRDLILIAGGLFLLFKATVEIHHKLEGEGARAAAAGTASFARVIVQIALLDVVFSIDSVITAIGMARDVGVMITAILISVVIMLLSLGAITRFVERHPTLKVLALSFLLLIGVSLVADGLDLHIPKGYIYFAMAFSVFVEFLNIKLTGRLRPRPVESKSSTSN